MRNWALPLLALLSTLALSAQESATLSGLTILNDLKIPVELTSGVKSDKAHPGDVVKFHMAEAILAGKGMVIPQNAKLYGRVVRAGLGKSGKRSVLSLVMDRAEWKGHVLILNAYVTGWGKRQTVESVSSECDLPGGTPSARSHRGPLTPTMSNTSSVPTDCAGIGDQTDVRQWSYAQVISGIDIYRNPSDGSTVLVSNKNIHLPGGILLMFQNVEQPDITAKK